MNPPPKKWGLSSAPAKSGASQTSQRPARSAFGEDGGDDDDDDDGGDVDAAIRAHAEKKKVLLSSAGQEEYDFDGTYDAYSKPAPAAASRAPSSAPTGPKYLASLLESSAARAREKELAKERTLAKEAAAEDALHPGKEKFVTASYKRKLEERDAWVREEEETKKKEEREEAQRMSKGGMAGFYRNVNSLGRGGGEESAPTPVPAPAPARASSSSSSSSAAPLPSPSDERQPPPQPTDAPAPAARPSTSEVDVKAEIARLVAKKMGMRAEKVEAALERYSLRRAK